MFGRIVGLFAFAAVAAAPASALTYFAVDGAPDPGVSGAYSIVIDFEGALPTGYSLSGSYGIVSATIPGQHAQPAPNTDTDRYFYVSSALPTNNATLLTPDLRGISFYWGSIDTHNMVEVLGAGGSILASITGLDVSVAGGNQGLPQTNRRVFIEAGANEVITGLRFSATGVAFELDDIAVAGVPEPATWAMLILGFGLVGFAARRRDRLVTVSA